MVYNSYVMSKKSSRKPSLDLLKAHACTRLNGSVDAMLAQLRSDLYPTFEALIQEDVARIQAATTPEDMDAARIVGQKKLQYVTRRIIEECAAGEILAALL